MSEQQEKDKKDYEAKERQTALKKSRERKLADLKVNHIFKIETSWYCVRAKNVRYRNFICYHAVGLGKYFYKSRLNF